MTDDVKDFPVGIGLKNEDLYEAMQSLPGYLDLTPGDFTEL
jgi:hypothetical protein